MTALIAALGIVLGATATGVASVIAANRKVREVELVYMQRLRENYLENARAYTQGIYMPLATSLTRLSASSAKFQSELEQGHNPATVVTQFYDTVGSFTKEVRDLQERGAGAFLTTALESELENLIAFLEESREAATTKKRATVELSLFGASIQTELNSAIAIRQANLMSSFRYLPILVFPRVQMMQNRVVAAAPQSDDFGRELALSIRRVRVLVKEVTLGAQASQ